MFFSLYTGEAPPICSYYKLLADGITEPDRVLVLQWNKHATQLNQKPNNKKTFNFAVSNKIDFIQYKLQP